MGNLNQDAGAIAGLRVATTGTAMSQVDQDLDTLQHDVMRLLALDIGDEPDTTPIMFVLRAVEPLGCGRAQKRIGWLFLSPVLHFAVLTNLESNSLVLLGRSRWAPALCVPSSSQRDRGIQL